MTSSLPFDIVSALQRKSQRLVLAVDDETWTGEQFLAQAAARAEQLVAAGIKPGDVVLVAGERGGEFWIDVLAVWSCGCVYAPIGESIPLDFAINLTHPKFILGSLLNTNIPSTVKALGPTPPPGAALVPHVEPRQPSSLSTILFTNGSTGAPKGVMLSDSGLLANAKAAVQSLDLRAEDKFFMAISFRFASANSHFIVTMLSEAAFIATEDTLSPLSLSDRLDQTGATCIGGSPIHARWVADAPLDALQKLRWIKSSGDNLSSATISAIKSRRPSVGVYTSYGLTEIGPRFCYLYPNEQDEYAGCVGRPMSGFSLAIVDDDGNDCAVGDVGEVIAKGPGLMLGYINDPETSRDVLAYGGFRTGDLGHLNDQGILRLVGRKDDVFKVMGKKVHSMLIQDAAIKSGLVADAAVLPDEDISVGTVPCLYYVCNNDGDFNRSEMMRYLRRNLSAHMIPRKFVPVTTIPRTLSGKIDRRAMKNLKLQVDVC